MEELKITLGDATVATLSVDKKNENYFFKYNDHWIKNGFAISPHLPFTHEVSSATIKRFLENLIPEGEGLTEIASFTHISKKNTFAIIHSIGYDTAGALFFGEKSEKKKAIFREITTEELTQRIKTIESQSIAIWDKKVRLSLAGVQPKLPVIIKDNKFGLANGTLSSTHIMKFQTKKNAHIVVNELFCMKLAKAIGLKVAEVELNYFGSYPVLLVKRFDRIYQKKFVQRLHVIDACQMLDLPPSYKYEQNFGSNTEVKHIREGASFDKLFTITKHCEVPAVAQLELLQWSLFNLIIGNSDAHGKNFSFFVNNKGIQPTPYYDLLSVMLYDVDHNLAMAYGDEFNPNEVLAYQLREFSEQIGINHKLVSKTLLKQCNQVLKSLENEVIAIRLIHKEEKEFVQSLKKFMGKRAEKFREVALEMPLVSF